MLPSCQSGCSLSTSPDEVLLDRVVEVVDLRREVREARKTQ